MNYDEWLSTEPTWDGAAEYVPCAGINCPMLVEIGRCSTWTGSESLCPMCKATAERAKLMGRRAA